ncbi:hypothetical protein [Kitasatospora sp. Root187]|uniref:hypothetical protein n=1 Tax=unclassified Kitasatospora TaxID=2633591 RepID=UPI000AE6A91D
MAEPDSRGVEFLVIGECVADVVRAPGRPDRAHPGGRPANVAYGLARPGWGTGPRSSPSSGRIRWAT